MALSDLTPAQQAAFDNTRHLWHRIETIINTIIRGEFPNFTTGGVTILTATDITSALALIENSGGLRDQLVAALATL